MELRHLRYFVAVAEESHFGRAAQHLHIAQSPLSQQVKHLENELGVILLVRSTRRVELTPAGARFLERARAILASVEAAAEEATQMASGLIGRIAIGFTGSATYELLPVLSRRIRTALPGVELDLRGELLTPGQEAGLLEGSLDIGFLRPPVRSDALVVRSLRHEPLVVVLPDTHKLADVDAVELSELKGEAFVTYPARHRSVVHDAVMDACRAAGFVPPGLEVAETSTLVSLVAAGLGVALVPASVQHLHITGATYRPLSEPRPMVELAVATRRDDPSPLIRRVLDLVHESLDENDV